LATEDNNDEEKPIHYEAGIPIFSPTPKDKDADERARQKSQQSHQQKELSLQGRILWTQIGLVVFGILGTGISAWQATTAQESADTSERSVLLAQKSERDTQRIATKQLNQAKEALNQTITQSKDDERAWVIFSEMVIDGGTLANGHTIAARIKLTDVGKTPARGVTIGSASKFFNAGQKPNFRVKREKNIPYRAQIIFPNNSPDFVTATAKDIYGKEVVLNEGDRQRFIRRDILYYVWGEVSYFDVSDRPHFTKFCAVMNPDLTTFHECTEKYADAK
jgi:hypothetical protein